MNLVLIETLEAIEKAADYVLGNDSENIIVALALDVMLDLDERGIEYVVPDDYLDRKDLYETGYQNFQRLEEFGEKLGRELEEILKEAGLDGVNSVFLNYGTLKTGYDSFVFRIQELLALFQGADAERIIFFPCDTALDGENPYFGLAGSDPIYSMLTPLVAASLGLATQALIVDKPTAKKSNMSAQFRAPLKRRLGNLRREIRLLPHLLRSLDRSKPRTGIFFGEAHDLPQITRLLATSKGVRIFNGNVFFSRWWRRIAMSFGGSPKSDTFAVLAKLQSRWRTVVKGPLLRSSLCHQGVIWASLVEDWLEDFFTQGTYEIIKSYNLGNEVIKKHKPEFLLALRGQSRACTAFQRAFRDANIPVIYSQEGGGYGYDFNPMDHYVDLSSSDYFLAYGAGVTEHFKSHRLIPRQQSVPVPMGSIRLAGVLTESKRPTISSAAGCVEQNASLRNPTVMHVPTGMVHSTTYSFHPPNPGYLSSQKRIWETFSQFPSANFILKLPPSSSGQKTPIIRFARQMSPGLKILYKPLPLVLKQADAFVIDWASTTLLEALTTQKPIFVYMDYLAERPQPNALELLRRRAFVSTELDDFIDDLHRYLTDPVGCIAKLDLTNTDFLNAYGTPCDGSDLSTKIIGFFESV